ncbi:hypothetical protein [Aureibacillus halotolerans]|uniref:hypothetical protein n=1 Tax=Aureibacillus halotolerans TaxID=1508390 RepID=UPI001061DB6D|nr:hypothetical protein [Aureibacillus halotolerans]
MNFWKIFVSIMVALASQWALATAGILNLETLLLDFIRFVVIFSVVYGILDVPNLKSKLQTQR